MAYRANNFVDECVVSIKGLTMQIMQISERVKLERAHLVVCLIVRWVLTVTDLRETDHK